MRRLAADAVHQGADGKLVTNLLKRDTVANALGLLGPRLAIHIDQFDANPWSFNAVQDAFRVANDLVGRFLDERCNRTVPKEARTKASTLYSAFKSWCEENGDRPVWQNTFGEELIAR